jgi:hypothetical protein
VKGLVYRHRIAFLCDQSALLGFDLCFRPGHEYRHIGPINAANMTPKASEQRRNF